MESLEVALDEAVHLLGAFVLALPLAWDREQADRSLGLRTFPLVAIGSCAFVLLANSTFSGEAEPVARVMEGTVTGIGFLGAAAVVKRGITVHGSATAAAIWVTAAIGVSVALGAWTMGIVLCVLSFGTLRWLVPFKRAAQAGGPPMERPDAELGQAGVEGDRAQAQKDEDDDGAFP
jgi:putative Mg2+ transporter-C (MgtC) family protein